MKKTVLALAALVAGVSAQAASETSSLAGTIDITGVSNYIFRGAELADKSAQPSIELSYGAGYAGVWSVFEINDEGDASAGTYREYDFYAGYNFALGDTWKLDVGATQYVYFNQGGVGNDDTSFEFYTGLNGATGALTHSLYLYHDFDIDTYTAQYTAGYSIPAEFIKSSFDLGATVGYNVVDGSSDDIVGADSDYLYYSIGVAVPYQLSENARLAISVAYVGATEDDFSAPEVGGLLIDSGKVVTSIGLSVGF
jgi:uncharacterized protein (TIGR02001 family)